MSDNNSGNGGCGCLGVVVIVLLVLCFCGVFKTKEKVERLEQQIEAGKQ